MHGIVDRTFSTNLLYLCNMIQNILVISLLVAAVAYLGRIVYKSFQAKNACATGCGKCAESAQKAVFPAKN